MNSSRSNECPAPREASRVRNWSEASVSKQEHLHVSQKVPFQSQPKRWFIKQNRKPARAVTAFECFNSSTLLYLQQHEIQACFTTTKMQRYFRAADIRMPVFSVFIKKKTLEKSPYVTTPPPLPPFDERSFETFCWSNIWSAAPPSFESRPVVRVE